MQQEIHKCSKNLIYKNVKKQELANSFNQKA